MRHKEINRKIERGKRRQKNTSWLKYDLLLLVLLVLYYFTVQVSGALLCIKNIDMIDDFLLFKLEFPKLDNCLFRAIQALGVRSCLHIQGEFSQL